MTDDPNLPDPWETSPRGRAFRQGWDNHPQHDLLETLSQEGGWVVRTEPIEDDPDQVAIWFRPEDPRDPRGPGFEIARHPTDL